MIAIGVAGGIGSGKSEVCRVWKSLGAFVVDSDELAKTMMQDDPGLRNNIIRLFGPRTYHPDGSLNRDYLAREAFTKKRVQELNDIIHPALWKRSFEIKGEAGGKGYPVYVQEAAILLDNRGATDLFDVLVLVKAPEKERIMRVMTRNAMSEQQVRERMEIQKTVEDESRVDYILINDTSLDELREKAAGLYRRITETTQKTTDN